MQMLQTKKTKAQLINEINVLKSKIEELENGNNHHKTGKMKYPPDISFYQMILEHIIDGVWAADSNDVIYFTNRGMELIAGISRDKIVGQNFLIDFPKNSINELRQYYIKAKTTGHPIYYHDIPVITPSTRLSYQSGWFIPYFMNDTFQGIICTVQDATRQKQTDEELIRYRGNLEELVASRTKALSRVNIQLNREIEKHRKTEAKLANQQYLLKTLMDNIPDHIYFKDMDSRFIQINKSHAEWFDLKSADEAIGKTDSDFFAPEHAQKAFDDEKKIIQTGEPLIGIEEAENWPDGHETWASTSKMPLRDSKENIIGTFGISRDITDKKRAEKLLKESEERYRIICENSVDLISIMGFDGQMKYASPSHKTILGYDLAEIIGQKPGKFIHKEDHSHAISIAQKYFSILNKYQRRLEKTISTETVRLRIYDKSGKIHLLDTQGSFTKKGIIFTAHDVTEKIAAEQALRESEKKYRELVDNTHIGIYIVQNYKLIFCNQKVADFFGYESPSEIFDKPVRELVASESWERVKTEIFQRETGQKHISNYQFKCTRKDGTLFDVEVFGRRMLFSGKSAIQGTMLDITESLRSASNLKISEERFRKMASSIRDGITIVEKSNVVYTNDRACEIYGYPKEEYIRKSIFDFVSPDSENTLRELKAEMERKQTLIREFDLWITRKDSTQRFVRHQFSLSRRNDEVIGHFIISTDITNRKLAEEKLKASLNEKEVLLREVHHRVKNNLQVISSLLNLQSSYVKNCEVRDLFKESQNRIKSMALIHERLYQSKDLANIDFGEYSNRLIRQLFSSYKAGTKRISYSISIHEIFLDINTAIPCGLIINELVTNALKHAFINSEEGKIDISLHMKKPNSCKLIVSDNGIGFPEKLDFRATETLGLQLVVTLVEQLNGKITLLKSNGTRFKITFDNSKEKLRKYFKNSGIK